MNRQEFYRLASHDLLDRITIYVYVATQEQKSAMYKVFGKTKFILKKLNTFLFNYIFRLNKFIFSLFLRFLCAFTSFTSFTSSRYVTRIF